MIREHWRDIFIGALCLIIVGIGFYTVNLQGRFNVIDAAFTNSSAKVRELSDIIATYRTQYMPVEFKSVDDFKTWVDMRQFPTMVAADMNRALAIQAQALKDGKIVGYEVTINNVTKGTEWWPITRIGNEVWCIEPQTNQVTKFYPTEWWR